MEDSKPYAKLNPRNNFGVTKLHNTQFELNLPRLVNLKRAVAVGLALFSLAQPLVLAGSESSDCSSCIKKATALFSKGEIIDASKLMEKHDIKCKDSFQFQLLYSIILSRRPGYKKQAAAAARNACRIDPGSATAHLQLGMCLLSLKDKEGAANAFSQLVQNDPTSYEGWSSLGLIYTELNMPREAKMCAQKAACLEPQSRDAKLKVASNLVQIGRLNEARDELTSLIMDDTLEPEFLILVAKEALRLGAYEEVIKAASKVMETYPDSQDTLKCLAQAQLWQRQYSKCLKTLDRLKSSKSDQALIQGMTACCHLHLGDMKLAQQARDLSLKADPSEPLAQLVKGILAFREGRVKEAISALRESLAQDQRFSPAHIVLSRLYMKLGDTETAFEEAQEVRRRPGYESEALALEGRVFLSSGFGTKNMTRAREKLVKALNIDEKNPDGLIGRSVVNMRAGNISEAEKLAGQVLKNEPGNVDALVMMARIMALKGDQNQSRMYMKKAEDLAPGDGDMLIARAEMLIDKGNVKKAISSLESSIATYKEFPRMQFTLAKILYEKGDRQGAVRYFKESLSGGLQGINAKEARRAIKEIVTQ